MSPTSQHTVTPEDIMALLDGELPASEAKAVSTQIDECSECAGIAAQFRETAHSLAAWTVPAAPESLDAAIQKHTEKSAARPILPGLGQHRLNLRDWRLWMFPGAAVVAAVLFLFVASRSISTNHPIYSVDDQRIASRSSTEANLPIDGRNMTALQPLAATGAAAPAPAKVGVADMLTEERAEKQNNALTSPTRITAKSINPAAPMIARTVSLTILVSDVPASRAALDAILARHQGYAAQLNINTPENDARSFNASLRIPASELATALPDLRKLGRVQSESQSGEEVSQQHADLVARLNNARETEQRLLAILQQRTGKVSEVLEVEEQISNTRGEIERMEAEQKALEHRVDFASVDLQLTEEYKAQLNPPSSSIGTRMRNAFVAGIHNAGSTLLAIVLFFEEYGPVLLLWLVILATPVWLLWRRYRRAQTQI
jgi:anti-sigma factor RsiW